MKIQTTTTHEVTFTVEAFWNEEGGMGEDTHGKKVDNLADAIHLLELARSANRKTPWVIVATVKTEVIAK